MLRNALACSRQSRKSGNDTPPRFWPFEVFGGAFAPQTESLASGASSLLTLGFGGALLCPWRFDGGHLGAFAFCAGGEVGVLETTTNGVSAGRTQTGPSLDAITQAVLTIPIGHAMNVRLGARLGVALLRELFVYSDAAGNSHTFFDRPVVSTTWDLGLAVALP